MNWTDVEGGKGWRRKRVGFPELPLGILGKRHAEWWEKICQKRLWKTEKRSKRFLGVLHNNAGCCLA